MALKTDYKDDILDLTQNDNRRFELIENPDDTVSFSDVTVYEQEGDNFTSRDLNETNTVVNQHDDCLAVTDDGVTELIRFGVTANGEYGYKKVGADSVTPFKTKHTETYSVTSNGTKDMGEDHKYRYLDVNVPNTNTGTFTVTNQGVKDMGATNGYRYVNSNISFTNTPVTVQGSGDTQRYFTAEIGSHYIIYSKQNSLSSVTGGTIEYADSIGWSRDDSVHIVKATTTTITMTAGRDPSSWAMNAIVVNKLL